MSGIKTKAKRHKGEEILIPEGMDLDDATRALVQFQRSEEQGNEDVRILETFPYLPMDGAHAFKLAAIQMFGNFFQDKVETMFGTNPPTQVATAVGVDKTELVPWGNFTIPGIEGRFSTDVDLLDNTVVFQIDAVIKKKHEEQTRELIKLTGEILATQSIYKGKAIEVRFDERRGYKDPKVSFMQLDKRLFGAFNQHLQHTIEAEVLLPIQHPKEFMEITGGSLKRGVLFVGTFGTGKTLTSSRIGIEAEKEGWTFIYIRDAANLPEALFFAKSYQPSVVFAEDIDLVMTQDRTESVNEILNIMDGIDSKTNQILTVMTTNNPDVITEAMRRPGRIDSIVEFDLPDKETASRIVEMHGGEYVSNVDLEVVGELLEGCTPAMIVEVVRRARLRAFTSSGGKLNCQLSLQDLEQAAHLVLNERGLLEKVGQLSSENGSKEKVA